MSETTATPPDPHTPPEMTEEDKKIFKQAIKAITNVTVHCGNSGIPQPIMLAALMSVAGMTAYAGQPLAAMVPALEHELNARMLKTFEVALKGARSAVRQSVGLEVKR